MTKCSRCKKGVQAYGAEYCDKCVTELVEKRIREKSKELQLAFNFNKINDKTADAIAADFLYDLIKGKRHKLRRSLLESVTQDELNIYATAKKFGYKPKEDWLLQKIQELQIKYPGTIESLVKTAGKISEIENRAKFVKNLRKKAV